MVWEYPSTYPASGSNDNGMDNKTIVIIVLAVLLGISLSAVAWFLYVVMNKRESSDDYLKMSTPKL